MRWRAKNLVSASSLLFLLLVDGIHRIDWMVTIKSEYNTVDVVPQRWWLRGGILIDDDISKKMLY